MARYKKAWKTPELEPRGDNAVESPESKSGTESEIESKDECKTDFF